MSHHKSEVFCWPWTGFFLGLEEYLLNPELRESATRSGGAQCEAQSLSCSVAPGSHCSWVHNTQGYCPDRKKSCVPWANVQHLLPLGMSGHHSAPWQLITQPQS